MAGIYLKARPASGLSPTSRTVCPHGSPRRLAEFSQERQDGTLTTLDRQEYDIVKDIWVKGGLKSSMNYYRAVMTGANVQDDKSAYRQYFPSSKRGAHLVICGGQK